MAAKKSKTAKKAATTQKKSETIRMSLANGGVKEFSIDPAPPVDPDYLAAAAIAVAREVGDLMMRRRPVEAEAGRRRAERWRSVVVTTRSGSSAAIASRLGSPRMPTSATPSSSGTTCAHVL